MPIIFTCLQCGGCVHEDETICFVCTAENNSGTT